MSNARSAQGGTGTGRAGAGIPPGVGNLDGLPPVAPLATQMQSDADFLQNVLVERNRLISECKTHIDVKVEKEMTANPDRNRCIMNEKTWVAKS